jgi:quinol-cytochrome oxidoreductase complex cytochrome b subunit
MVSERSIHVAVNTVAFLLLYSLLAGWVADALSLSTLVGGVVGMVGAVAVFAALDVVEVAVGGDLTFLGEGSRLHAVRGLFVLYLFFLVAAGTAGALDTNTALPVTVVVLTGAVVATLVVFGPLVGYYYRRSVGARPA